jgi:hypothetical protein
MTELKRRTRVVSFRLSEEEHKELTSYCVSQGVRSLSDFARLATFVQFESQTISEHADTALQQIYRRLAALDREVQRLGKMIGAPFDVALDMRASCAAKTESELALRQNGDRIETNCAEGVTSAA